MRQGLAERSFQMLEFQAVTSEFHRLPFVPMVDIDQPEYLRTSGRRAPTSDLFGSTSKPSNLGPTPAFDRR